jgi:hypothetical protein
VTKRVGEVERNISDIEPENPISTGVMWRSYGNGLVPIYEEHSARLSKNIGIDVWMAMTGLERAFIIATRRIEMAIENQRAEAEIRKSKADAARQG